MRHRSTALACALTATLGLLALPASGARADSSVPLTQLTGFHQIVVDSAEGYIFLSEGVNSASLVTGGKSAAAGSAIVVTDLSGNYVTTLDTGKGVEGLALSSDGGTLYAALAEDDAVGVIDTATLTQTAEYSLGTAVATPYSLALQSGKLWVSYNGTPAGSAGEGAIGDLDLSAASPALETQGPTGGWYSAPDLAADPSDTGVLAAAQPYSSPARSPPRTTCRRTLCVYADGRGTVARRLRRIRRGRLPWRHELHGVRQHLQHRHHELAGRRLRRQRPGQRHQPGRQPGRSAPPRRRTSTRQAAASR